MQTKTGFFRLWSKLDEREVEDHNHYFSMDLEKVRVTLDHSYDFTPPEYIQGFVGKSGTLTALRFWDSRQATIELDSPHSQFGNFARLCYPNRAREVVYTVVDGSVIRFFIQCDLLREVFVWPFYKEPNATDCTFEDMQARWKKAQDYWKNWRERDQ